MVTYMWVKSFTFKKIIIEIHPLEAEIEVETNSLCVLNTVGLNS